MSLIYIVEDEPIMADCIAVAINGVADEPVELAVFNDGISAMAAMNERLPDVLLLDIILSGPDGFALLNEMLSYPDTAKIPVVLISSLDLSNRNLEHYGVVQTLDKSKMTPEDIYTAIKLALASGRPESAAPASIPEATVVEPVLVPPASTPASSMSAVSTEQPQNLSLDDLKQRLAASQDPHAE